MNKIRGLTVLVLASIIALTGFVSLAQKPEDVKTPKRSKSWQMHLDINSGKIKRPAPDPSIKEPGDEEAEDIVVIEGMVDLVELPKPIKNGIVLGDKEKPLPANVQVEEYMEERLDDVYSIVEARVISVQKGDLKPGDVIKVWQQVILDPANGKDWKTIGHATPLLKGSRYLASMTYVSEDEIPYYGGVYRFNSPEAKINLDGKDVNEAFIIGSSKDKIRRRDKYKQRAAKLDKKLDFSQGDAALSKVKPRS